VAIPDYFRAARARFAIRFKRYLWRAVYLRTRGECVYVDDEW
jgi:hypothetical protein